MTTHKTTSMPFVILALLKHLRIERNLMQVSVANQIGKTVSVYGKVENGQTPLTMDVFLNTCNALRVTPTDILHKADLFALVLVQTGGWDVLPEITWDEDDLLNIARSYQDEPRYDKLSRNGHVPSRPAINASTQAIFDAGLQGLLEHCLKHSVPESLA